MEKLTGCFLSALLLAVLNSVLAENTFFGEGGELLLRPPFSRKITSIQWKHNNNLVAEWVKDIVELQYYGDFRNRTTLDPTTGNLKVTNMSRADSGVYSMEINNNPQFERYNAKLIKAVPQPVVLLRPLTCTAASENCTLTCDGNTEEAEPVTYSWKMGGGEWMVGEKDRSITNDETIQSVETFSCRMRNPISEKESAPKPNPFIREKPADFGLWIKVLGAVMRSLAILALLGAVVYLVWQKRESIRKRICPCLIRKGDDDDHYDDVA